MVARRLAEVQPERFAFSPDNLAWAERVIAKFPQGREASAVIPLLWRAQEQEGWITKPAMEGVAAMLGMPLIRVLEVATFIPCSSRAGREQGARAGLRHDALHAERGGGYYRGLPQAHPRAPASTGRPTVRSPGRKSSASAPA
jgi:hypothetical protein